MTRRRTLTPDEEAYLRALIEARVGWRWPVRVDEIARRLGVMKRSTVAVLARRLVAAGRARDIRHSERQALDARLQQLRRVKRNHYWPVPLQRLVQQYRLSQHYVRRRMAYWSRQA